MTRERPILFSAPMVRAILAGTKTQTRRVVKPKIAEILEWFGCKSGDDDDRECDELLGQRQEERGLRVWCADYPEEGSELIKCPYGQPGDRLWVRERFVVADRRTAGWEPWVFAADYADSDRPTHRWKPSIHMPRWASRINLEVTGVRVERLQDISEADAQAEGARECDPVSGREVLLAGPSQRGSFVLHYRDIWEQINGPESWKANPWVWVVEFQKVKP